MVICRRAGRPGRAPLLTAATLSSSFSTRRCTAARRLADACVARSEQQELLVALAHARLAAGALSRPLLTAAAWSSFSAQRCSPRPGRAASGAAGAAGRLAGARLAAGARAGCHMSVDSGGLVFFFGSRRCRPRPASGAASAAGRFGGRTACCQRLGQASLLTAAAWSSSSARGCPVWPDPPDPPEVTISSDQPLGL